MHAIGSGSVGDSEYLHATSPLTTTDVNETCTEVSLSCKNMS